MFSGEISGSTFWKILEGIFISSADIVSFSSLRGIVGCYDVLIPVSIGDHDRFNQHAHILE
jgi:hypothetical protein